MKIQDTQNHVTFEKKSNNFKHLIIGSKSARIASILLIAFSIAFVYYSRENKMSAFSLLLGIVFQVFYIFKYLGLKGIEQNPNTPRELSSNLSKFKIYMKRRKKNELLFLAIWILSCIPAASMYFGSQFKAAIGGVVYILFVGFLGHLAFKKADKEINKLEADVQML